MKYNNSFELSFKITQNYYFIVKMFSQSSYNLTLYVMCTADKDSNCLFISLS